MVTMHPISDEKIFHELFETSAVGLAVVKTETGQVIKLNKAFTKIFGYTEKEIINNRFTVFDFLHPENRKDANQLKNQIIAEKINEICIDQRCLKKDHTEIWIRLHVKAIIEDAQPGPFHVAIIFDITENKRAEKILKEKNDKISIAFNAIDAVVYVADMTTYDLLFRVC